MRRTLRVRHIASREPAIAQRVGGTGCILVQFNRIDHPHGHGWHLYPRHHFVRRKGRK